MKIQMTGDIGADSPVYTKIMCYARPKIGKTVLCATAPKPFIISAEGGMLSLSKSNLERIYGKGKASITYNIPHVEISTISDLDEVMKWIASSEEAGNYSTMCMDSGSEIADAILGEEWSKNLDKRPAWQNLKRRFIENIKKFRDIRDKHVYMTFRMATGIDDVTGQEVYKIEMPASKLTDQVPYLPDIITAYRVMDGGVDSNGKVLTGRYLQTVDGDGYQDLGDRSGMLSDFERPNLTAIFNKIAKGIKGVKENG